MNIHQPIVILLSLCISNFGIVTSANASLIGSFGGHHSGDGRFTDDYLKFDLYYGTVINPEAPTLFSEVLTGDSVFTLDSGSNFDLAASRISDGINSFMTKQVTLGNGGFDATNWLESHWLYNDPSGSSGVDLNGFEIDQFVLTISNFQLISPGSDPNGDGIWSEYSLDWSVNIHGAVIPIPPALWLFGSGLLGLFGITSHKKVA
jgi:hypothetical protein